LSPRRRLLAILIALPLALLIACSGSKPAPTPTVPPATETPAPTATPLPTETPAPMATPPTPTRLPPKIPAAAVPFSDAMRQEALQYLQAAATIRNSPPKGEIAMYTIGRREALDAYYEDSSDETQRSAAARQDVYALLALVMPQASVQEQEATYLGGGITGYYDPELKAFFLVSDQGGLLSSAGRATVVHEFTHALQDQYYDLTAKDNSLQRDWDALRAWTSLIEGDAATTENAYMGFAISGGGDCFLLPAVSNAANYAVTRDITSWYDDGGCFVKTVLPQVSGIDAIFQRPPSTTEQLLHPEKYIANEGARPVFLAPLESALGAGWTKTYESTLGEYELQNLLVTGIPGDRPRSSASAAGWGGDRWALYANGDARLLYVTTVWDTPNDASEFYTSLFAGLRNKGGQVTETSPTSFTATLPSGAWRVALNNDRITLLVATNAADLDRVASAAGVQ
jgi:hypothetical protein